MRRVVAALLACSALAAEDAPPPAAEAPLVVEQVPDVARLRTHLQQSPLGAIWALPELAPLKQRLDDQFGQVEAQTGIEPWALLNDLDRIRVEILPRAAGTDRPVAAHFGLAFASQTEALWKILAQLAGGAGDKPITLGQLKVAHDGAWLWGAGIGAGEPQEIAAPTDAPADADVWARVDLGALWRAFSLDPAAAVAGVLGLKTIDSATTLDADGARDTVRIPGAKLPLQAIEPDALGALPADAIIVDAVGLDGERLEAQLSEAAKVSQPVADRLSALGRLCSAAELGDVHALLKGLKGTFALAVTSGAPFPAVTVLLPATPEVDRLLDTLAAGASVPLDQARTQAVVMPLPAQVPITAQVRRTATQWVLSTDALLLGRLGAATPPSDGFDAKAEVALALGGPGEARALLWQDNAAVARLAQAGVTMAMGGQRRGRGDRAQLMQDIAKALGAAAPKLAPTVGALAVDDAGATLRGRNLAMQTMILGMGAGMALPAIAQTRAAAKRSASGNNERQIVLACLVYANENGGNWPATLDDLVKDLGDQLPAKLFTSPSAPELAGAYLYVRPSAAAKASQPVLVEDPACNRGRGSMTAFADGHVEFLRGTKAWDEARRLSQLPKARDPGIEAGDWAPLGQQGAQPPAPAEPPAPQPQGGGKTEF